MIFTCDIVIEIQERLIQTSGGMAGIRDVKSLDSALQSIYQTFDGSELYPTIIEKAARLGYSLNASHPFVDGNKRIAMHMIALFLRFHEIPYLPSNEEVIRVGLSLANNKMTYEELVEWVHKNSMK